MLRCWLIFKKVQNFPKKVNKVSNFEKIANENKLLNNILNVFFLKFCEFIFENLTIYFDNFHNLIIFKNKFAKFQK